MSSDELAKSPLGKETSYSKHYDPGLLCPIERVQSWLDYGYEKAPYVGVDIWNAYELSWLNELGKPQVAMAEFLVPLESPNLVESKSLKLYLNSFNQTSFKDQNAVSSSIKNDLSSCAGATVEVHLKSLEDNSEDFYQETGFCLDTIECECIQYSPDANLLSTLSDTVSNRSLFSHLLKTNCPVTGQPDWGSLFINYSGKEIDSTGLLKYIVSYREHDDFHEQCVERIFLDIMQTCEPEELSVYGRYLRRGGLDINPFRSTTNSTISNKRVIRQ